MAVLLALDVPAALAQVPTAITIPPLPEPSLVERYLFEDVWAPGTILAVAAMVFAFILLKRQLPARALAVGGLCAALSAAVFLTGWLVETTREQIAGGTREMVY
ncbi:MAG TPA: hypothetical protein VK176_08295, partial [Phycisphaerales bacterium]|nr:hypothetical protein [Phycisphaerales bacterium]